MNNLADQLNQLIDISHLPNKITVKSGWQAHFLVSNINYENQSDVLPRLFVEKLLKFCKGNDMLISLGEPTADQRLKFSGENDQSRTLSGYVFDQFCVDNNLRYFFISKLVEDEVFIALTPDEYSIILSPENSKLLRDIGGREFLNELNRQTVESNETDFTKQDWNTFNITFSQL